jgi:DNA repair protein RecO (recombination protein O)
MHWIDDGIILSTQKYGENSLILHALTRMHGRYSGMVRGGTGKRLRGIIQPGNLVSLRWNGRLAEQLGTFSVEAQKSSGTLIFDNSLRLSAASTVLALLDKVLPEREAHERLFEATCLFIDYLQQDIEVWGPLMVRWELGVLSELGYGLDLSECVATGQKTNLRYVSPKSARAVCEEAGFPYRERLLPLPEFLKETTPEEGRKDIDIRQILEGLRLSGYFIQKNLLSNYTEESLPARERLILSLGRQLDKSDG